MSDRDAEDTPLLLSRASSVVTSPSSADNDEQDEHTRLRKGLLWRLYVSHFLSTWNMRSYEFTVILLFAAAYPDTLLPTSIRGVLTNGATLLFSSAIGRWVDRHASRFRTMGITIVVQRACVIAGCLLWMVLFVSPLADAEPDRPGTGGARSLLEDGWGAVLADWLAAGGHPSKTLLISGLILLGIIERICAVGNNLVMERDWVPTIASEVSKPPLHALNATMRRIDLVSKILAPVFVSVVAIRTSTPVLAIITAAMNLSTAGIELVTAKGAWARCRVLRLAREPKPTVTVENEEAAEQTDAEATAVAAPPPAAPLQKTGLRLYLSYDVCLASLSSALQSFSVLSLSGPMTTFLLTRHYSLSLITTARTAISVIEIGSTLVFPPAASFLTRHPLPFLPHDAMTALGLTGVTLQLGLLVPCVAALLVLGTENINTNFTNNNAANSIGSGRAAALSFSPAAGGSSPPSAVVFLALLGLSRLGHWTHNLAVQQLVQTRVPAVRRVEFSGVEMAAVSAAEIGRWAAAAVWSRPAQFKGVALGGLGSVVVIWLLFAAWAWRDRRRERGVGA